VRIEYIEELDEDTNIGWWNTNRKKLNSVIQIFNDWQIKHRFEEFEKEVLIARIKTCRKYGDNNDFSDWQYEILDDMEKFIAEFEMEN